MDKVKTIGLGMFVVVVFVVMIGLFFVSGNWSIRYKSRLDAFFGKGKWEVVSDEVATSKVYAVRSNSSWNTYGDGRPALLYRNWNILCENAYGEEEVWKISNLAYHMNNKRYRLISPKRFKESQALTLELMDISFEAAQEQVRKEIIEEVLTEEEAECMRVNLLYHDGNPPRSFYDKLAKEDWFTIEGVTAGNYLASDLYDFYLFIGIHDYKLDALTKEQQKNVIKGLEDIEKKLLEEYGENASFEILCSDYSVEYVDGVKQ